MDLTELSDEELEMRLKDAAGVERQSLRNLLEHLIEFDNRKLYLQRGCPHLFAYCTERLGYSEDEACRRIHAARCAKSNREILDSIEGGRLTMTAVNLIAPHIHKAHGSGLFEQAEGKTRKEIESLIAAVDPQPERHEVARQSSSEGPEKTEALTPSRVRLALTVDRATYDLMQQAKDLLRHKYPSAQFENVIAEAMPRLKSGESSAASMGQSRGLEAGWRPLHFRGH
jgi:hypothetical protein